MHVCNASWRNEDSDISESELIIRSGNMRTSGAILVFSKFLFCFYEHSRCPCCIKQLTNVINIGSTELNLSRKKKQKNV